MPRKLISFALLISFLTLPAQATEPELASEVRSAIEKNLSAKTRQEWLESGQTPAELFAKARAIGGKSGASPLCEPLSQLHPSDLALFEEEIESAAARNSMECAGKLQRRIQAYWNTSSMGFEFDRAMEKLARPNAMIEGGSTRKLESIEMPVDISGTSVFFNGGLAKHQIAITLDDGPHPRRSARILDILKSYGVRVTYFQTGENAKAMPEISARAAHEGHSVGSHSYSHQQLNKIAARDAQEEILKGREAVAGAVGYDTPFFRFPYGARNGSLQTFVKQQGLSTFFWNMDSLDWKYRDVNVLWQKTLAQLDLEQGGIFLFHDIHEQTVILLPRLLDELAARGWTTVVFVPRSG